MSVIHGVWVGPYAEWLVRPEEPEPNEDELATGKISSTWGLTIAWGVSEPPEIKVAGVVCRRFCFVPKTTGRGRPRPKRQMNFSHEGDEGCGIEDLRGVDAQAEIEWFVRAFSKELKAVEKFYGRPPRFGWGVVGWYW
jgi:hypothetical protein